MSTETKVNGTSIRAISPQELLGPLTDQELKFVPTTLYVTGRLHLPLLHPRVAIVGTRRPSAEGLEATRKVATTLAQNGVTVVSGLARGIDTAAHTAAIEADGTTIAVLGTPISRFYPAENSDLQRKIMRDHLAVSQFPEEAVIRPVNFVLRNRTMALMGDASVIMESGEGGGSLDQGWETLRLGRPLFIHTQEFEKPELQWPTKMARYGAIRFREPADILEWIPSATPSPELAVAILDQA